MRHSEERLTRASCTSGQVVVLRAATGSSSAPCRAGNTQSSRKPEVSAALNYLALLVTRWFDNVCSILITVTSRDYRGRLFDVNLFRIIIGDS